MHRTVLRTAHPIKLVWFEIEFRNSFLGLPTQVSLLRSPYSGLPTQVSLLRSQRLEYGESVLSFASVNLVPS